MTNDNHTTPHPARPNDHPVLVAMGASAGGIQALQAFFASIPEKTGACFVVIVHLDPDRRSDLPRILGARTNMPVIQVDQHEKLRPDHVYVIPPNRRLQIVNGGLNAVEFEEPRGQRSAIDQFFRSVADGLGDGFAVILSGAGADGALGVRAVKESGGIILVQDPNEAEYPSMPRAAISTGVADMVLPVVEITKHLTDLIRLKQTPAISELQRVDEDLLRRVLAHLRVRTGHDFSKYKRSTVLRRIARRMQVTRSDSLQDYYKQLRESPEEAQALLADLLISVTSFFRDHDAFEALRKLALPQLFSENVDAIRVWVSGCATGEEAYSVAMLLMEEAGRHELRPQIQVFASDLDTRALATAREGRYPAAIKTDVSEDRLSRFFIREGDAYRVRQELRDLVLFAAHDLLKDPPFSRVDLITCRNVLIYLDRDLQEQVSSTFHYALNPRGYLLVGSSETADHPPGLFRPVDRNARLYASNARPGDKPRTLPRLLGPMRMRDEVAQIARISPTSALNEAAMHRRAIEQVAPPSILVDETHRIIHLSDHAGRYLLPSGGPLSGDVVDLVRSELRFELRSALHRVFEQHQPTLSLPILVRFNGGSHRVILQVRTPNETEAANGKQAVVMFIEGPQIDEQLAGTDQQSINNETVQRLTQELDLTQSRLRTVREESDATNEELRAANEELQSINEEYRSTSEELETSKEELQSINEELQTVNSELKIKLEAVSRAHSDLQNLLDATDIGTLFLDSSLRIKRFTDRVTELFSITPRDEGRPITDFAHKLEYDDLIKDARSVLAELTPVRREVRNRNGQWYDVRVRPYRTLDNKIDGIVITFVDISERLQADEALRVSEQRLKQHRTLLDLARDPIFVWNFDGGILEWNRGCEALYGFSRAEALGKRTEELLGTAVPGSSLDAMRSALLRDGTWSGEVLHKGRNGRAINVDSRLQLETVDGRRLVFQAERDIGKR
jgi:two-component system CheB/CheR fusion protein